MATLEITVSNKTTGGVKLHEIFEMDDATARLFIEQLEKMLAGFEKPIRVVKTITPGGVTTIDIMAHAYPAPPPIVSPTFEEMYRRALLPPKEGAPV
jgi:hypothetical protein